MTQEFKTRQASPDDINFIYSTWANSYRFDKVTPGIRNFIFFPEQHKIIDLILAAKSTSTLVACDASDPFVVFGYIVCDPDKRIAHYIYVKEAFQGFGIGTALFAKAFGPVQSDSTIQCSHKTKRVQKIFSSNDNIIFNPYLLCATHLKGE